MDRRDKNLSTTLGVALRAADAAADISRAYYAGNFTVEIKADMTPVTQADVECEEKIREIILNEYPEDGFYGEESGRTKALVPSIGSTSQRKSVSPFVRPVSSP